MIGYSMKNPDLVLAVAKYGSLKSRFPDFPQSRPIKKNYITP